MGTTRHNFSASGTFSRIHNLIQNTGQPECYTPPPSCRCSATRPSGPGAFLSLNAYNIIASVVYPYILYTLPGLKEGPINSFKLVQSSLPLK